MERSVEEEWLAFRAALYREKGGLASGLRKTSDGDFVAYAKWTSRKAAYESLEGSDPRSVARQELTSRLSSFEVIMELDDDELEKLIAKGAL